MCIMIVSDSPDMNSGYSRIITNLGPELQKLGYNIAISGIQTALPNQHYKDIKVYQLLNDFNKVNVPEMDNRLTQNIKTHKSDVVLCLFQGDSKYNPFTQHKNTVWYIPIEGHIIYKSSPIFRDARKVHKVVSMTHCAGKQLTRQGINNTTIYLGHDSAIYKKGFNNELDETVPVYFPETNDEFSVPANELLDMKENMGIECMFGFVGQNFGVKKRIERLIEAFSIFAKDKTDVHLHLHCHPEGKKVLFSDSKKILVTYNGLNLFEIIDYYNIRNKITFSYGEVTSSGWSESALSNLYNIFDVYASASSGEGFGLPHLESMACGVPQLAPDGDPFPEFFGVDDEKCGLLAKCTRQLTSAGEERALVDVKDLAEKMEIIYAQDDFRRMLGSNAQKWASEYTWSRCAAQFDKVFRSM